MAEVEQKVKSNRGGYRPGSGRKPAKVEQGVRSAILLAIAKDPECMTRIWTKILERAEKGSYLHQQLLFNYYYGKPTEVVELSTKQMILKRIIVNQ